MPPPMDAPEVGPRPHGAELDAVSAGRIPAAQN